MGHASTAHNSGRMIDTRTHRMLCETIMKVCIRIVPDGLRCHRSSRSSVHARTLFKARNANADSPSTTKITRTTVPARVGCRAKTSNGGRRNRNVTVGAAVLTRQPIAVDCFARRNIGFLESSLTCMRGSTGHNVNYVSARVQPPQSAA